MKSQFFPPQRDPASGGTIFSKFLNRLLNRIDLSSNEAQQLMEELLGGKLTPIQTASILTALRMKQETAEEILGFIKVIRKQMLKINISGVVIDTCGTGGDGKETFNISTATALVVAGAGVAVAKHGNRNASSLCGSADVLEALGVKIDLSPKRAETMLQKTGFTFLFAPLFHPAMKFVAQVRKELKIRTVFNFIGPFVNPAQVNRQLIGVPSIDLAKKLSKVAVNLDYEHLLLVSSEDGLDEISLSSSTHIFEIKNRRVREIMINPQTLGFRKSTIEEIKGGDAETNAEIIKRILSGEIGPKQDIVILNSAAALYVAGKVKKISEGIGLARMVLKSGKASKVLEKILAENTRFKNTTMI